MHRQGHISYISSIATRVCRKSSKTILLTGWWRSSVSQYGITQWGVVDLGLRRRMAWFETLQLARGDLPAFICAAVSYMNASRRGSKHVVSVQPARTVALSGYTRTNDKCRRTKIVPKSVCRK
jgi:hypothetical protein